MQFLEKIWENSMLPLPPTLTPGQLTPLPRGNMGYATEKYTVNGPIILIKNFYRMI